MSQNKITKLTKQIFHGLQNVAVINLTVNLITSVGGDTFISICHKTVHSLNRKVCCMSGSWLKCKVKNAVFSNCDDLLPSKDLRYVCWLVGILTTMINLISIFIHIKLFYQLQTNKFFTFSLSLVDCLYEIYLLTISSADWHFRGHYVGAEYTWKESFACKVSSFIALVSLVTSPIISSILMLARFCVIQWPLTTNFKCEIFSRKITLTILITIIGSCLIVVITFVNVVRKHILTGVCILLYTSGQLTEFFSFVSSAVICIQIFCLISNVMINSLTILALIKLKSCSIPSSLKKEKYNQIINNLFLVILANMCCWIPSTVVFILPLTGYQVSTYLLTWVIILVVPINYIVNPILFSILTPTVIQWFSSNKSY